MQAKHIPLLKYLLEKNTHVTASSLSDHLGISVRTVKTYIRELNESTQGIIASSAKGYLVDRELAAKVLFENKSGIPQTARERAVYIINCVVKNNGPVHIYDLCDELFISVTTLRSVFPRIRKMLEAFQLTLDISSDALSINGLEKNKRKLLSSLLYNESNKNFVNLEVIQHAFLDIDITFIRDCVLNILSEYHYFVNDYSLINLVLHVAIAIDRIQTHQEENEISFPRERPRLLSHEYELCGKVIQCLEERFHVVFSENEISEMALLLVSRATSLNYQSITAENLEEYIGKSCMELVHEMISAISAYYYINLNEPEFLIRFALHIKNLLIRAETDHFSKNPLTDNIRASCPLIYDNAVWISSIMKDRTGLIINDDEIAYIAFHLGSALEAQKELANKLSVILYCPTCYNMYDRLYDILSQRFSMDFMVANIIIDEADLHKITAPDLIIATVPMNRIISVPYIQVQPFLSEADLVAIHQKVAEIRAEKKRDTFISYLKQLMLPEFFERCETPGNWKDVIHYLCQKLLSHGYVNEHFETEVLEREEMSSTGFQNFAIPHALKMNASKTGMFIYLCDTPIDWHGTLVSLVILLCFNREERYIFNEIFEPLTMILTDSSKLKKALTMLDYESFIHFLSECL